MSVALNKANGQIEQLQADNHAFEQSMHSLPVTGDSRQPRDDSAHSLDGKAAAVTDGASAARIKLLEDDNKRLEDENVRLEDQLREMRSKLKLVEVDVATLNSRILSEGNKLREQLAQAEVCPSLWRQLGCHHCNASCAD